MRGRQLTEAVLVLELQALLNTLLNPVSPGIVLLDQKAAFPSVLHQYLFFILEAMKLPASIVDAIRFLYRDNVAFVKF